MPTINFIKINGAGNDFILIDKNKNSTLKLTPELIRKICDRRKGIGADGVLVIIPNKAYDFELKYFNSDGFSGTLCGNGARCSIKYVSENNDARSEKISFLCNNEVFSGKLINDETIEFYLNKASDIRLNINIKIDGQIIIGDFINTGSPHFIINWDNIKDFINDTFNNFNIYELGKKIRFAKKFNPEGTNVNFIKLSKKGNFIRTYERGVEDETLACGTGVVASAIIVSLKTERKLPLKFITYGGDTLKVSYYYESKKKRKISLTGPAKINYIGTYNY